MQTQIPAPNTSEATSNSLTAAEFRRRFRWLIFLTWNIPPVFGLGFILLIGVLTPAQMLGILVTPLEPAYILGWLAFAMWFLPRAVRPVEDWLAGKPGSTPEAAVQAVRLFPLLYWATFLIYLAVAPASVIVAAEIYTGFVATPYDWFRIELVALIVSIVVGLPIFFLIFDLFGKALGGLALARPIVTIRTKVFLIGALVPLLIDTMLVQYYWTRTGFFTAETFGVWLLLELLAIGGSLIFAHSFGQALGPLQRLIGAPRPLPQASVAALTARSTDELGLLTSDYRQLLDEIRQQSEVLDLGNRLLRSAGGETGMAAVFASVVDLCRQAVGADQAFLIVYDPSTDTLLGVAQTGAAYRPEGYYRITLHEASLAVWAFTRRETVAVADAASDPRVSQPLRARFGVRSAMATPLRLGDETLGVLMVAHTANRCAYGARETALIEGLAREAALALHSQQLRAAREQAEAELQRHRDRLEVLVRERTAELEALNRELDAFSYSVSHDLRAPLRAIDGFAQALSEDYASRLDDSARDYLGRIRKGAQRMGVLIEDFLQLSRVGRAELQPVEVYLSAVARDIASRLAADHPARRVTVEIAPGLSARGDARLLHIVLSNLFDNAWKYTSRTEPARIEFRQQEIGDETVFMVRDNGAGFDMQYAGSLFRPFQRLHRASEFEGTGVGLAIVARIVHRHGGRVWAQGAPGAGAAFYFTLSLPDRPG
jgi:signal transduction histidine kinase